MADARDLGSRTERCRGSTPLSCNGLIVADIATSGPLAHTVIRRMPTTPTMTDAPAVPELPSTAPLERAALAVRVWRRRSTLALLAVLALLLTMAWPAITGRSRHRTAPPNDGIPWRTDFAAAVTEAKKSGKPLLLDFGASWCPPCQVMRQHSWPDPRVRQAVLDGFVPVYLDADDDGSIAPTERYGISTIPAVLVVDAKDGAVLRGDALMDADELLAFLTRKASVGG